MHSALKSTAAADRISLNGREVEFRLVPSKTATKLRIRISVAGVEVIRPAGRDEHDILAFLQANSAWITNQLDRIERFRGVRKPKRTERGSMLFRGLVIGIEISEDPRRAGANQVIQEPNRIIIVRSSGSATPPSKTLENWLRKQARKEIAIHLEWATAKLKRSPNKVLIMGQRTKWGNCSALQNLSFNWRLIMAPDSVLRYLVIHEAVHLAIPDHSQNFWLTVRSLCPETERAKQWLCTNAHRLHIDLEEVCNGVH
jgi:predicted metal-dependent hydrolase